jgi:neutral ceramidase
MIRIGTSQLDITPDPGVELSGFAARIQPSTGVLDPLHAKGIYITDSEERLLWIHTDLVGLEREFVQGFREWAEKHLGLQKRQIMISATHTHSGPGTIHLLEAGTYDPAYMEFLQEKMKLAAKAAMANPQDCEIVIAEGKCNLAVDRRTY